jgi:hypothetical protein
MNKFFEWLGEEVISWFTAIIALCIYVGVMGGAVWFASWTIKGLLHTWGIM